MDQPFSCHFLQSSMCSSASKKTSSCLFLYSHCTSGIMSRGGHQNGHSDKACIWVSMTCSVYSIEGTVPLSCQNLAGHCYSLLDTSLKYLGLSGCSRRLQSSPDSSSERHQLGDFFSHRCQASQSKCAFRPCFSQRTAAPDTDNTNHKKWV